MTITQKIMAARLGRERLSAGEPIELELDLLMANDITAPVAINELENAGLSVKSPGRVVFVLDHFTPCRDIESAQNCARIREFAKKHKIDALYDIGDGGVEHVLLPERGHIAPGELIIGADSHTCTYGALGAFSTGVGSTDLAYAMATGKAWFKTPSAIRLEVSGKLRRWVSGKDVILDVISRIGVDGARYRSMEFTGDLSGLSIDDRFTISNMSVEAGAKNGIFEVDDITRGYLHGKAGRGYSEYKSDGKSVYDETIKVELDKLELLVACPHLPSNVKPASQIKNVRVDQVVIGSCTNGRLSDIHAAAEIMRGRKVAKHTRCIVIPATRRVYLEALREGYLETLTESGAIVSAPTCGPCLGGHMGVLSDGETAVSTTNRNFVGRMGHRTSRVYLSGPAVAAASAIAGEITVPE